MVLAVLGNANSRSSGIFVAIGDTVASGIVVLSPISLLIWTNPMNLSNLPGKLSFPRGIRWHLKRLHHEAFHIASGPCDLRVSELGPKEVRDVAKDFNAMADAMQSLEKLATAGKKAVMITHEVRNPLSSIGLNLELLREELETLEGDRTEAEVLSEAIAVEVERLTEITEEYLRLARGDSKSVETTS